MLSFRPTTARRWATGATQCRAPTNPFRVLTSLLRLELIADPALREEAAHIVARRQIFTPACQGAINQAERHAVRRRALPEGWSGR